MKFSAEVYVSDSLPRGVSSFAILFCCAAAWINFAAACFSSAAAAYFPFAAAYQNLNKIFT